MKTIYMIAFEFNGPVDREILDQSINQDIKNKKLDIGADNVFVDDVKYIGGKECHS